MKTYALDASVSVPFDANGRAVGQLGPTIYGHSWKVERMTTTTADTERNEVRVYMNSESPNRLIGGSDSANQDFDTVPFVMQTLDRLIIVWSLGTPGVFATFNVFGTIQDVRN